jgi:uncharacterized heparinase superfamily protein
MRSVVHRHPGHLVDGSPIRLSGRLRGFGQMLRSTVALVGPAVQLGKPAIGTIGAAATQALIGLGRRVTAIVEPVADDIDIALVDLSPADADIATDIYAGIFTLGGKTVATHGRSVFTRSVPSQLWACELHGFAWLRHLRRADTPLASLNARALIEDWIALDDEKRTPALTLQPAVVAARLRSWLTHAAWLLRDAPPTFRQRLISQVTRDFRLLRRSRYRFGQSQITVAASLLAASIAVPAFRRYLGTAHRQLDAALKRQILADGGHISRNPSAIVEILGEIVPLRAALAHAGIPASTIMMNSIDRMVPMVRFFLSKTGIIAHFNGASHVAPGLIEAILAADDADGHAHGNASHSGYQRLEAADTAVIIDCGSPPPAAYAGRSHAGTLSFEFASQTNRFVINCGTIASARPEWRAAARETAAHSTITVAGTSSAIPIESGVIGHLMGPTLIAGPRHVHVDRREHAGAVAVVASHDGYAASHNLIHERTLRLSASGDRIDGRDLLVPSLAGPASAVDYAARFHLDPAIQPVLLANGVVMLFAPDGEAWEFHADDIVPTLEDSVYLADPAGPILTRQIVLSGSLPDALEQRWTFVRTRAAT